MTIIADPTLALSTITGIAKANATYRVSYNIDTDGSVFNGHGATVSDVLGLLARATRCDPVAEYSEYGYHHTVAFEASRDMNPPQWALPGTLADGRSVVVLVSLSDTPAPNSMNIQGLADPSGLVTRM